jgi:hypothetical protein
MTTSQNYAECAAALGREIELLDRISALQAQVRSAIINREWTDFEGHFESLAAVGAEFEALDLERARAFARLAGELGLDDEGAAFYSCAARLPDPERQELSELYRRLKMRTLELRLASESLAKYLGEIQSMVSGFLEAVFPDRKGKIYTRQGTQVSPDMRSMVLNQSL